MKKKTKLLVQVGVVLAISFALIMPGAAIITKPISKSHASEPFEVPIDQQPDSNDKDGGQRTSIVQPFAYTLTGLQGTPMGINDLGQVVGRGEYSGRAVLWQNVTSDEDFEQVDLGTLGGSGSKAWDINNHGQIVGQSSTAYSGWGHVFVLNPEDTNGDGVPDVWNRDDDGDGSNDLMQELGTVDLWFTTGTAINDNGQITGWKWFAPYYDIYTSFIITPIEINDELVWYYNLSGLPPSEGYNDLVVDLGMLPDRNCAIAFDINNLGNIVGECFRLCSGSGFDYMGFFWNETTGMQPVGSLGGGNCRSWAWGINNLNQIVGASETSPYVATSIDAFLIDPDQGMLDLGVLKDPCFYHETDESYAWDVNDKGYVVGKCRFSPGASGDYDNIPYLLVPLDSDDDDIPDTWFYNASGYLPPGGSNDLMFILDYLIQPSSWCLLSATRINERGQIIGVGACASGVRGYVITPLIPGDTDRDCDVDLSDLAQLLGHYGTMSGATWEMGDFDGDGDVDLDDLAALLANYGYGT